MLASPTNMTLWLGALVPLSAAVPVRDPPRGAHPGPGHRLPGDLHLPRAPRRIALAPARAPPSRTNASRSITAGRSRIDSSTPSGTTHVVLDPIDFIARLAALVPRPRAHLTRYHGVFASNCKHLVPRPYAGCSGSSASPTSTSNPVACVAVRCVSSRASKRPNSSRPSSSISPRARPAASITPAHRRSIPRKPNPRTPPSLALS